MSAWTVRRVADEEDWTAARAIRRLVFVDEQHCPEEEEWDAYDEPGARGTTCVHLIGLVDGEAVAVARWHGVDLDGAPAAKLERFAVRPAWRGGGLGRRMVEAALADARAAGHARFVLHAQAHLEEFYASFGFRAAGDRFEEAGIEHVKMVLTPG